MQHKLGVIVPYRDRAQQLTKFLEYLPDYLSDQGIDYEIVVVEQMGEEGFNRGALLNAGFLEAKEAGCDYVVFHDVDLLPRQVDYSYSEVPLELVDKVVDSNYSKKLQIRAEELTDDYFGGVTLFPVEIFEKINGYSNKYVGWGFEDNDLLVRCREALVPIGFKNYRQYCTVEPALTFSGINSYAKVPFEVPGPEQKGISFLVTFKVEDLVLNRETASDECAIFSIPGYDADLCYESFGTYKFEIFDDKGDVYSVHTKKYPLGITIQAIIVLDFENRVGKFFINNQEIGKFKWPVDRTLKFHSNEVCLGVGNPTRVTGSKKWMRGQVSEFAIFDRALEQKERRALFQEGYLGLGRFRPRQWYSGRVVGSDNTLPNLAERGSLDGKLKSCEITPLVSPEYFYRLSVPLKRQGVFVNQPHETNGTENGYWKSWATRLNQLRYRDMETLGSSRVRDGLTSIRKIAKVELVETRNRVRKLQVTFTDR